MANFAASAAIHEFHKRKLQGKTVSIGGVEVKYITRAYGGVDVYYADGSQERVAADATLAVTNATSVKSRYQGVATSSPWQGRKIDSVAVAANAT